MSKKITAHDIDGKGVAYQIDFPDECPICHRNVSPSFVGATRLTLPARELQVVFRCTSIACDNLFIGIYSRAAHEVTALKETRPQTPIEATFEETISNLSPPFVTIYNQALAAEAFDLDQVVGIALRKALEFLIKDFAIKQFPDKEASVKKTALSGVINNFIDDINLKRVAERAVWLGNDETHYERIWNEKDLKDLKRLIHLSVNWIDNVLTSEAYIDDMPKKSKEDLEK